MKTFSRLLQAILVSSLPLAAMTLTASAADSDVQIVDEVRSRCHGANPKLAPKIDDIGAWHIRLKNAGSVMARTESVEHDKGNMSPRGGDSSLSDTEVQSAIKYMLGKSGVSF